MNRKEQDRLHYMDKREKLKAMFGEPVSARDFYNELFPFMSFEGKKCSGDSKPNGILTVIEEEGKSFIVSDDHDMIEQVQGKKFVVMPPLSFFGRQRTKNNARELFAFTFDLDGQTVKTIDTLFYQMEAVPGARPALLPRPTFIVHSGHGVHLYYMLQKPIPLYKHLHRKLNDLKYALTKVIWNPYTSIYKERGEIQYQNIFQAFRMPGTLSKLGKGYPVLAFRTGAKCDLEYLNQFLLPEDEDKAITDLKYHSVCSLEEAKTKYPEWYQERIVEGKKKKSERWHVNRALYEWWKRKIATGAQAGHRYHCITVMAAYAVKCDVPKLEAIEDAMKLLPHFNTLNRDENDTFTKRDIKDAFNRMYSESYIHYSRKEAERVSGIPIPANKRNGRTRAEHVKLMNFIRDEIKGMKGQWQGRKNVEYLVKQWRACYPEGIKKQCQEDTGLDPKTIRKWWGEAPRKYERRALELKGYTVEENARLTREGQFKIEEWDNKR